mmetsp:Transcript_36027/g.91733  ORF Transcript_36027/g.91733 Transcript_36027/m.91733 type:complete len:213 (+) Transcript_36027:753-1391(+)
MRSASSKHKNLTNDIVTTPLLMKSVSRPGVAVTMSAPKARSQSCGLASTPPYTSDARIFDLNDSFLASKWICEHSSLVGAMITAFGAAGSPMVIPTLPVASCSSIAHKIGRRKAHVFPDPVCAQHMASKPESATGMANLWIGVGLLYLHRCTFSHKNVGNWKCCHSSSKELTGVICSDPMPDISTGMSSYLLKSMPTLPSCLAAPKSSFSAS